TKLTRRWARRGTRPSAPKDQRRSSAWIFGAISPLKAKLRASSWTCFRKVESFPEVKGELDDEAKTVYEGI
ncbi:hypothetical protein EWE75_24555, partial [Sphingomonas populi]